MANQSGGQAANDTQRGATEMPVASGGASASGLICLNGGIVCACKAVATIAAGLLISTTRKANRFITAPAADIGCVNGKNS